MINYREQTTDVRVQMRICGGLVVIKSPYIECYIFTGKDGRRNMVYNTLYLYLMVGSNMHYKCLLLILKKKVIGQWG